MTTHAHIRPVRARSVRPSARGLALSTAALAAVGLGSALGLSACGSPPQASAADRVAVTTLNGLASNAAGATANFTPAMAKLVPPATLSQDWQRYQQALGAYQSHGQPQDVAQGEVTVVNVPLVMTRAPGQLRVTVDRAGHVAGLFFLAAPAPAPAHPAAFVESTESATRPAALVLSSPQVRTGQSYTVTATGFTPGESVAFSWTGPTSGVMGTATAGPDGQVSLATPVLEKDRPGGYYVTATGINSGRTATAPLQVLPAGPGPR